MRRLIPLVLFSLSAVSAFAAEDTIRRGFRVADGGTLRLEARAGDVTIVSGGTGVAVEIIRSARGRRAAELLAEHEIEFEQRGDDVIITSKRSSLFDSWLSYYSVQWNIRIPARYNVEVRSSGGSIELSDIGGTVDARSSGGGIKAGRLAGPANLTSSGGSITVEGAASDLDIHTSGGGIRIEDAAGRVDATSSGGGIRARFSRQPGGDSRLSTSGGGVTVTIARDLKLDLDAKSSGGSVRSDVPVTMRGEIDDNEVRGQINGGGPKLVLRSSGGGIRISQL